jgi:hypothetical protein
MTNPALAQSSRPTWKTDFALWFALLAGPVAWLLNFHVGYVMAPRICAARVSRIALHAFSGIFLALCITGFVVAWRAMGQAGKGDLELEDRSFRSRFMGLLSMMSCALFALIIIGQIVASIMIDPCPE